MQLSNYRFLKVRKKREEKNSQNSVSVSQIFMLISLPLKKLQKVHAEKVLHLSTDLNHQVVVEPT